jgi:excinuclease ABC subunit A
MAVATAPAIELRGVRVHNLKSIDVDLPLHRLIAISGVSGSGKSSLAFDTLYAEGQRRYVETFSAYARQFLDRLEKPDADRIDHIPPAIALKQGSVTLSSKATVATTTEIHDYLRLLFAKIGHIICPHCGREIRRDTPESIARVIDAFAEGTRFQVCCPLTPRPSSEAGETADPERIGEILDKRLARIIVDGQTVTPSKMVLRRASPDAEIWGVIDRLTAGSATAERVFDSIETAFALGSDRAIVLEESISQNASPSDATVDVEIASVDERPWRVHRFSTRLVCDVCRIEFAEPEPRLFSFNTPLGACPTCQGFGAVPAISFAHLVPDPSKSLREGAIVAWTTPAYRHELDELLRLARDYDLPVDVPFSQLEPRHLELIEHGVPERKFGGLVGFFRWLERHRYKLGVRVFLNRWRSYDECPDCRGARLQPLALVVRIGGLNIAELCRRTIADALEFFDRLDSQLTSHERTLAQFLLQEVRTRLGYLADVGLGYVTLDRTLRTLSSGEAQRVALTSTLGSSLVNTLYVLDEPSAGLHPRDNRRVIQAVERLRDNRNTVVVVEHDAAFLRAAEHIVDIGPAAGRGGGEVVFTGTPDELAAFEQSVTGRALAGTLTTAAADSVREHRQPQGMLRLEGARTNNLQNLTVEFPLGVLCVVTGVSGSGKSSLLEETLYPALCQGLKQPCGVRSTGRFDRLAGVELVDEVLRIDQTPIGRTPRSNPVTYLKVFDEVRSAFASTPEARARGFSAREFSFNAKDGGQCPRCNGGGVLSIDMQFLADVTMTCPECYGTRYRREILEVKYRGLSIAEVLDMTAGEAFGFFRNQRKLQKRLSVLKEIGLDYLPLGQPATTLSGGESQRLKLAAILGAARRARTLFLIDEPTRGLHPADVVHLLTCFDRLLAIGHSLVVIEHDLAVIRAADHIIDLGPEAGAAGGRIVATGAPADVAAVPESLTGQCLRR